MSEFMNPPNLNTLFTILLESDFGNLQTILQNNNKREVDGVKKLFMENVQFFKDKYSRNSSGNVSLLELNQQFLLFMMSKGTFEQANFTSVGFQQQRVTELDQQYHKKRQEFLEDNEIIRPPTPIFQDDISKQPVLRILSSQEIIAQRNKELEEFNKSSKNVTWGENQYKNDDMTDSFTELNTNFLKKLKRTNNSPPPSPSPSLIEIKKIDDDVMDLITELQEKVRGLEEQIKELKEKEKDDIKHVQT